MVGNRLEDLISSLDGLLRVQVAIAARALTVARVTVTVMKVTQAVARRALTVSGTATLIGRWSWAIALWALS